MTKKILSLIICLALVCSTMFVANVSATGGYISDGYLIYEDFEDGTTGGFSTGSISEWDDGKAVHLSANSYYTIDLPDYYIYEFDINKTGNMPYNEDLSFKDGNAMNLPVFAIILHTSVIEKDIWYTYRIMVDQKELGGVTSNEVNRPNGIKLWRKVRGGQWENCVYNTHYRVSKNTAHGADGTIGFYAKDHTQFDIDNVKLFDGTYVSDIWFEDENGRTEQIPEGMLTAKYDIANFGGFEEAVAVTAIYDAEGNMLNCVEKVISDIEFGNVVAEGESILMIDYPDAARVEAFLWTNSPEPQTIGREFAVLGDTAETEGSQTTTDFIAVTVGSEYNNDFIAVDRSTFANVLTIEGVHQSGESVPVAVKITADDRVVIATQFMSSEDGSFKKAVVLNPEICGDAEEVRVVVSGANTNPQEFSVPVFSNWDEMTEAFANAETASEIESYFNNFKDNFAYFESGKTELTSADVDSLNQNGETDDYEDIEFVKNKTSYDEDMTYADVVLASIALIESAEKAENFKTAFFAAKEECDAEEIGNLIENADFIQFPLGGVSNLAKVYEGLANSDAELETLSDIYAEFEIIHGKQKVMEESTIPSFRNVNSGEALKKFFADNFEVLGIDPEKYVNEKYDDDYAVMFGIYEGKFELCDTYEKVNNAIVFLDNYIKEYNAFLDSINNAEDGEAIREVLEADYSYIELGLADFENIVNIEYLYAELEDTEFTSLAVVRAAFADAVSVQHGRETNAHNDFMLISSADGAKEFFELYGAMIGIDEVVDEVVFYEVYSKFRTGFEGSVTDYATTIAQVNVLLGKVETAEAFIAEINAKASENNWSGLKNLYEGEVFAELIGISTETPEVNDIRSMYLRIAAAAEIPFESLTQVKAAFENAYRDQANYEEIAGGYESFDEELLDFVESAWVLDVQGNVITLKGKVEERGLHNISLYIEDKSGLPIYMKQVKTKATGDFELTFILNPQFYTSGDDAATLKVSGDNMNIYVFSPFDLYDETELLNVVEVFVDISNETELKEFFDTYEEILGLEVERDASGKITNRASEALYLAYKHNKDDGKYEDIEDVSEVINGADGKSGTESLMETMGKIISCLDELTLAANERIGKTIGNWSKIKKQVEIAIENEWIDPDVSGRISAVDKMYMRMAEKDYDLLETIEKEYEKAHQEQYKEENTSTGNKGGGSSSGGGDGKITSGGGGAGKTDNVVFGSQTETEKNEAIINQLEHPEAPFSDITSEYNWAKDSINGLRRYGIVRGDGNGKYRPGESITREEFLKILLDVFAVERVQAETPFSDVDKNAWYYDTVATAYSMGVVNGYTDGRFGIGDSISRADMAVMVCRMMESININLDAKEEAFLFNDFTSIPEYSYASVVKLQRAGILNGDTFGYYNPLNKVTRAEAAVAFWSIFGGVKDIIDYNWVTEYN